MDSQKDATENLGSSHCSTDLWIAPLADMLGCEPDALAICVAVKSLKEKVDRLPEQLILIRRKTRDDTIQQMRACPVNCGMSSTCSVAGWFKTSDEP